MNLDVVLTLLRARFGLDPLAHGARAIETAVGTAMGRAGFSDPRAYLAHLQRDAAAFEELAEAVLVPETWFFRYPRSFDLLAERALALPADDTIRVLCVPCSTGEEPYSAAMTLLDRGFDPASLRIVAVDVLPAVVAKARVGRYGRNSFRGADTDVLGRHGAWEGDTYVVGPAARDVIVWRCGSVLERGLLADRAPYDFVFFRNLLIYLGEEERRRALEIVASLLSDEGLLFVGHGELGIIARSSFRAAGDAAAFAARHAAGSPAPGSGSTARPASSAPRIRARSPRALRRAPRQSPAQSPVQPRRPARSATQKRLKRSASPSPLDEAQRAADGGHLVRARELCELHLRAQPGSARAHYLLGVVLASLGNETGALRSLERAVYLDPDHHEALVHLALQAEARGDAGAASAWHRRASRALARRTTEDTP